MSKYQIFVGIDVSKDHLDLAVCTNGKAAPATRIANTISAIEEYISTFSEKNTLSTTLFCLEDTGIYISFLLSAFITQKVDFWVENAVQIKRSLGLQRGKNDAVDAQRIAEYASRFKDKVCLYEAKNEVIEQLSHLTALRSRLVQSRKQIQVPLKETKTFAKKAIGDLIEKHSKNTLESIERDIKEIETAIKELINSQEDIKAMYDLTTSVVGVGEVTAVEILVSTQGFTKFTDAKKFACYCGVVPFEHSSGKFRGRNRVSKMANLKLKSLLHMCTLAATKKAGELKDYYERKLAEGKAKMSVLNALRNKIIQRIFACVQSGKKYEKNYQKDLVLS